MIQIKIENKIAERLDDEELVCSNNYSVQFQFDSEWEEFDIKVMRVHYGLGYTDVMFDGSVADLPLIENSSFIEIGVYAGNLHTTTPAKLQFKKSIRSLGGNSYIPKPSIIDQIIEKIDEKGDSLELQNNILKLLSGENVLSEVNIEESFSKSVEKLNNYLYKVTFIDIPDVTPNEYSFGACSSYVQNGKLYRNFDWDYNDDLSFIVCCKDFTGMSFGTFDDLNSLPYKIVDGVNKYGIMVATHILYNDWDWNGQGNIPLYKLPFIVLSTMEKIEDIENLPLNDLCNIFSLEEKEYVAQYIITDGTTTFAIMPSEEDDVYVYENITENPKLTNFKWVNSAQVERIDLQNRPTGVERYNLMPCSLSDLRFTKAYENQNRLSEFIGLRETTKESTDEELISIYQTAHEMYLDRKRDGQTWQTTHSVVYSSEGLEHLYIQENWDVDYGRI